jgi:predicted Zn-dependent peptidase
MEDLTAASLEDVERFFATYYTPDNAVLSIAGDFDPAEARVLVERYFGSIPRGAGKPPLPPMELPPSFGEWRREVVPDNVMLPRLFLAFRSPAFGTDEYYAASVLGAILGMGKGSRFQRDLVRERQVASEATAFTFDLSKGSDLLVADVTARPEIAPDALEREVVREIDDVREHGVSAAEVERATALIETAFVTSMQSAGERADKLSMFATYFGDPELVNVQTDRYHAVTAERVNAFARTHLVPENRASLMYVPIDESALGTRQSALEAGVAS